MARSNALVKAREIAESGEDPKQALLRETAGDHIVLRHEVLVATYTGSKFHAGTSIQRADSSYQESLYQGSVGLVIGVGPGAFEDGPGAKFYGNNAKVGDWVLYRPSDGLGLFINGVACRLFNDVNIKMFISDPELYW